MEDSERLLLPLPAKRLVRLMGEFPVICTELPEMLCLMEGGESVSVEHIRWEMFCSALCTFCYIRADCRIGVAAI